MSKLIILVVLLGVSALTAMAAHAGPITINSSFVQSLAYAPGSGYAVSDDAGIAFGSRSVSAVSGLSSSTTAINWLTADHSAMLKFTFDHLRSGEEQSYAYTDESSLYFTANENTTYTLSGNYASNAANSVYSYAALYNETTNQSLFYDYSASEATANESFILGVAADGDFFNETAGSLTGNLIAGHTYSLFFFDFIQSYPVADGGGSAAGCLTLIIGSAAGYDACGPASIPEPAPLALLGLGLVILRLKSHKLPA